uniref:Uncharacterized protein n=1 Tax=Glossina palpalis gambiensis TaxID=67801 RepID=A0A1B0C7D5_9MUSC
MSLQIIRRQPVFFFFFIYILQNVFSNCFIIKIYREMCHEMPLKLFCLLVAVVSLIENGFNYYLVEFTTKRAHEAKPCYYYDSESFRYLVHNEYFNFVTQNNRNQTAVTNNDFFFLPSTIAPRGWQDFAIIINIIFTVFNIALLISSPLVSIRFCNQLYFLFNACAPCGTICRFLDLSPQENGPNCLGIYLFLVLLL